MCSSDLRVGPDCPHQTLAHRIGGGAGRAQIRIRQLMPLLGVTLEVLGESPTRSQYTEQPHRGALVIGDGADQTVIASSLNERAEAFDGRIGISSLRKDRHQGQRISTERLDGRGGTIRLLEAKPYQLATQRVDARRHQSENREHPVALEGRDLGAVLLPLRALVAKEEVIHMLAQCVGQEL